jgi:RHS repeat-associated protein
MQCFFVFLQMPYGLTVLVLALLSFVPATATASRTQQYDAVGNTILQSRGTSNFVQSLIYNTQNRIIYANGPQGNGMYTYSDGGGRLWKRTTTPTAQGGEKELLNPGTHLTLEKKSGIPGTNMGFVNNIYLNGVRIAAVAATVSGVPTLRYYLGDQVNSVKVVLDGQNNVLARHEYLPYGEEFTSLPLSLQERGLGGEVLPKFNSQERDEESGLDFFNARHYDSTIARFVSADTVIDGDVISQGWNRYMYTHGNPVRYGDPTGHVFVLSEEMWNEDKRAFDLLMDDAKSTNTGNFYFTALESSPIPINLSFVGSERSHVLGHNVLADATPAFKDVSPTQMEMVSGVMRFSQHVSKYEHESTGTFVHEMAHIYLFMTGFLADTPERRVKHEVFAYTVQARHCAERNSMWMQGLAEYPSPVIDPIFQIYAFHPEGKKALTNQVYRDAIREAESEPFYQEFLRSRVKVPISRTGRVKVRPLFGESVDVVIPTAPPAPDMPETETLLGSPAPRARTNRGSSGKCGKCTIQ